MLQRSTLQLPETHPEKGSEEKKKYKLLLAKFSSGALNINTFSFVKKGEIAFWIWGSQTTLTVLIR